MTKEELRIRLIDTVRNESAYRLDEILNEFFSQNVVIPKGEKRHPYAELLHKWVEGHEIEWRCNASWDWRTSEFDDYEYRIKPSEPVYEWQWYRIVDGHIEILNEVSINGRHQFFTEYEADTSRWKKCEETKRERKQ